MECHSIKNESYRNEHEVSCLGGQQSHPSHKRKMTSKLRKIVNHEFNALDKTQEKSKIELLYMNSRNKRNPPIFCG